MNKHWELAGDQGQWLVYSSALGTTSSYGVKDGNGEMVAFAVSYSQHGDPGSVKSRAQLIAEAGTVYHETGKTPRELVELLRRIEPHLDAIVCYASTMNECDGNRLAADIRAALSAERKTTS